MSVFRSEFSSHTSIGNKIHKWYQKKSKEIKWRLFAWVFYISDFSAAKTTLVILNLSALEWENCNFCYSAFWYKHPLTNEAFANPICCILALFQTDLVLFTCSQWTLHTPVLQTFICCVFCSLVQHCIIHI